jgi:nucleoside-diphosphate-sugar epimerase
MRVLITGGAGFIGQLVAGQLLNDASHTVILADVISPPIPAGVKYPENGKPMKVDLVANASSVVDRGLDAVFIFHGIMSSGAEANFDLGMAVNIDATKNLLEALRKICPGVRVIYASSQAVYGQPLPQVVDDTVIPTPESSYGAQKIICETLVNDYTRRGFLDGMSLRFPTISVRPGLPTAAASSFLSGMIREPLNNVKCVIPVQDRKFESWVCSPKVLVENLLYAITMSTASIPKHKRQINVPGICVTVQDMMDALEAVGGAEKLELLEEKADPTLIPILDSWPTRFDNSQAIALGFKRDESFLQAVVDYKNSLAPAKSSEGVPAIESARPQNYGFSMHQTPLVKA